MLMLVTCHDCRRCDARPGVFGRHKFRGKHGSMTREKPSRRVGLARALSKLGYCSRSDGFDLIQSGRVGLNGATQRDPEAPVRWEKDRIEVDGRPVATAAKVYLMLNKPRGVITTASDEKGR